VYFGISWGLSVSTMLSDVLDFLFGFGSSYPGIRGFNATTEQKNGLGGGRQDMELNHNDGS